MAKTVFKDRDFNYVMLFPRGKVDTASSVNYKMIRKGYAKVDDETFSVPQNVADVLQEAQEYAQTKVNGIWKNGGNFGDEYDY